MHLADMDKTGVATAMLAQYSGFWFGDVNQARHDARELNEWAVAKMVGPHKSRFGLFASLPMPDVEGTLHEIEYAFDTLKADGVSIITSYDDKWLGDKSFEPVFEELNRRSAVVFTHPLEPACCKNPLKGIGPQTLEYPTDTTRTILSLLTSNTGTKYPNVKFIFSHAGGTLVSIAQRVFGNQVTSESLAKPAEPNSKLYQARHFYYDTAGSANPVQLQSLKLLIPPSQILFGTDYPFRNLGATVSGVQTSGLTGDELRGVFGITPSICLPDRRERAWLYRPNQKYQRRQAGARCWQNNDILQCPLILCCWTGSGHQSGGRNREIQKAGSQPADVPERCRRWRGHAGDACGIVASKAGHAAGSGALGSRKSFDDATD